MIVGLLVPVWMEVLERVAEKSNMACAGWEHWRRVRRRVLEGRWTKRRRVVKAEKVGVFFEAVNDDGVEMCVC